MKSKKLSENILKLIKSEGFRYINLDTVIEASVPVEPVGLDDQIAQAQQDGDWQTSSNLKADKLRSLTQKK